MNGYHMVIVDTPTIGIPKLSLGEPMFQIVMPDGTFRIANSIAERNQIIREMKEAYEGYLK